MVVSIIIPVYNEMKFITVLLDRVLASDSSPFDKEIIVVDDGSTDGTGDRLKEYTRNRNIVLITHTRNKGKTAAIKSALKAVTGDVAIIQDADLEYSPADYGKLLEPFKDPSIKIVYGSRFLNKRYPENMKLINWMANRLFTALVNILYQARITDEGTAYKAFRTDVLKSISIESSGFEFCPEVTAKLLKKGLRISEVPVFYRARNKDEGKKPGFKDGFKVLWTIIKCRFAG